MCKNCKCTDCKYGKQKIDKQKTDTLSKQKDNSIGQNKSKQTFEK